MHIDLLIDLLQMKTKSDRTKMNENAKYSYQGNAHCILSQTCKTQNKVKLENWKIINKIIIITPIIRLCQLLK